MSNHKTKQKSITITEAVKQFIEIAFIPLAYNAEAKALFHKRSKVLLKLVARDLGYVEGEYDLRSNKAGMAVSGEITLHTDDLYIQFSQSAGGSEYDILYRSCQHRKDYTGGHNHFLSFHKVQNYAYVLECFQNVRQGQVRNRTQRIAELNDLCRRAPGVAGICIQTAGICALPEQEQSAIREQVENFSDFTTDNNPYGERDFGVIKHNSKRIYWKIDYYDHTLEKGSENPADPKQTVRVLTIMLADEY